MTSFSLPSTKKYMGVLENVTKMSGAQDIGEEKELDFSILKRKGQRD